MIFSPIQNLIKESIALFDTISDERKALLSQISAYISAQVAEEQPVRLVYICTHNSRRSHYGQIWAGVAAAYYGIPHVETYSGGTEETAFNERAVAASERLGFRIEKTTEGTNPVYQVYFADDVAAVTAFSKKYDSDANPKAGFCAVMTCNSADKNCPVVFGASARVATPYEDPKAFDGTPEESAIYEARSKQIALETLYVFSLVK
ncbi:low molecular weight phosphatase family protein [Flectobacillus roseus]|uniref:Protein-tyrosine-phosphatase n=1 Tax=Flectobacillus roseus TaxID=502259 RepID=A0ABT6Y989_9BACT|nr:protein-tyrosine-phosphatase [Flectobacillus roseus]MDI9860034.1 protein-tyrosine-phosphatase [Flectobacillus roseus]